MEGRPPEGKGRQGPQRHQAVIRTPPGEPMDGQCGHRERVIEPFSWLKAHDSASGEQLDRPFRRVRPADRHDNKILAGPTRAFDHRDRICYHQRGSDMMTFKNSTIPRSRRSNTSIMYRDLTNVAGLLIEAQPRQSIHYFMHSIPGDRHTAPHNGRVRSDGHLSARSWS